MSNNIDLALSIVFSFYFVKRWIQALYLSSTSDFTFKSTLPWYYYGLMPANTFVVPGGGSCTFIEGAPANDNSNNIHLKTITYDLFIDVVINVIITILTASKIMIYIRSIETFSILSQLVLECLYDVMPFTLFFVLWMLFFSVL